MPEMVVGALEALMSLRFTTQLKMTQLKKNKRTVILKTIRQQAKLAWVRKTIKMPKTNLCQDPEALAKTNNAKR